MSLVNKSLPSGCLAGGIPCRVIRENCYPKKLDEKQTDILIDGLVTHFMVDIMDCKDTPKKIMLDGGNKKRLYVDDRMTLFDFETMRIDGPVTELTEKFKNECRRYGIRFRYYNDNGLYKSW
jgi:hypothetical protein